MWVIFAVALIICGVVTFIRHQYGKHGHVDPLTNVTRRILFEPVLKGIHSLTDVWQTDVASLFRGPSLARRNRRLESEVAYLMQQNRVLSDESIENMQLRALLTFKSKDPRPLLPAEVLSLKPFADRDTAIFSRGTDDKVTVMQPALDQNGYLAGQVTDVGSTTCDVMLLTDSLSSVAARVVDTSANGNAPSTNTAIHPQVPAIVGICVGDHSNLLQLTDLPPTANVNVGDAVVTSGLGEVYPKDIPIGKIVKVDFDQTRYLKSAVVLPYADFNHLQDGFLIQ
jgi:rod shape-determining protein MreC